MKVLRCSTAWLLARLNEPEPFVDASGNLGEDVGCIGKLTFSRLLAGVAHMIPKVCACRRKRSDVAASICRREAVPVERRPVGNRVRRSLGLATKLHDALGDQVRILLHSLGNLVEQLAQGEEIWPFHIPVRLPASQL